MTSNSAKILRPSQESLRNSFLLRSNKIFINENNHCVILDPQNIVETIRNSTMRMSQKVAPNNSLANSCSNFNLKASSVLQNQGNLTLFNKKKMEGVEKILNEKAETDEKLNILECADVIERNDKWLKEKMRKKEKMNQQQESEEVKECSFNPTFFTKGHRSSSNSRISTVYKNSEVSVFSSHRSINSARKTKNHDKNNVNDISQNRSIIDAKFEKLKIRGNVFNSKWYVHDSYRKEFERKREFSSNRKTEN